jgi:hypothetical protein
MAAIEEWLYRILTRLCDVSNWRIGFLCTLSLRLAVRCDERERQKLREEGWID